MDFEEMLTTLFQDCLNGYGDIVLQILRDELRVPEGFLQKPFELAIAVNTVPRLMAKVEDAGYVFPDIARDDLQQAPRRESACYAPFDLPDMPYDCIWFDTKELEIDAGRIGIDRLELARILLAHEVVHVIMINRFTGALGKEDERAWVLGDQLRYIHEGAALKVCELLPEIIATQQAKDAYLAYVHDLSRADQAQDAKYGRYFDLCEVPIEEYWPTLTQGSADIVARLAAAVRR